MEPAFPHMLYHAFVSYSHTDGKLAPAIQRALHSLGKPWYKLRALRVFRDKTSLSGPMLGIAIEEALRQSEWFLFLASPPAAQSPWVDKEITWWLTNRSYDRMLILLTDGELQWDDGAQDFDRTRTTAAPGSLFGQFPNEPLYIDLRWAKTQDNLSLRHLQFRSAILDVAAPIHGRPKDELDGDDVRQQRKNKRWAWSAAIALAVLAVAATAAAVIAVQQRNQAEIRRQVAVSRQIAALSRSALSEQRLDSALLLALESRDVLTSASATTDANTFEARSSLLSALGHGPVPIRSLMHGGDVVAFSPDGRLLASASGDQIIIWDAATGQTAGRPFASHDDAVFSIAFTPDGKTLASASRFDNNLRFWNLATRSPDGEPLTVHDGSAVTLAFSPDGKTFATGGGDGSVVFWNLATRQPLGEPATGHRSNVNSLAFSRDGRILASGSWDGTAILWDVETRAPLRPPLSPQASLGQPSAQIEAVALSPDGKLLATGGGHGMVLWEVTSGKPASPVLEHPNGGVTTVAFSPDGRYLAAGASGDAGTVMLWDVKTFEPRRQPMLGHMKWIESLVFSPDGTTLASAGGDDSIIIWDLASPHRLALAFPGYEGPTDGLAISAGGAAVAATICLEFEASSSAGKQCIERGIRVWDRAARKELRTFRTGRRRAPESLVFADAGQAIVSGSCAENDRADRCKGIIVERWDLRTGNVERRRIEDDHPRLESLVLSPDATMVAAAGCKAAGGGSTDCGIGEIRIFDIRTGRGDTPLFGHARAVRELAFSPDGQTIVSSTLDDVIAWSVSTRRPLGRPEPGYRVAFSRDGRVMAVAARTVLGSSSVIRLKATATNQPIGELVLGQSDIVLEMAFNADGSLLAVSAVNGDPTLTLWDLARHERLGQPLRWPGGRAFGLAFSPDGKTLISSIEEHGLLSWDVDPASWRHRACAVANRNLTYDEWVQVMGQEPYRRTCAALPIDPNMIEAGRRRARFGDIDGAVAIFERVRQLTSELPFDSKKEAIKYSVEELVAHGRYLAQSGDVEGGTLRLEQAKRLDPALSFDPRTEARTLAAPLLVARGEQLAQQGQITDSLAALARAQEFDPKVEVAAATWETLCWNGSLRGRAADVLAACDRAVSAAPEHGRMRTARGLAKALVQRFDEAIIDFEAFLNWEQNEQTHRMGLGRRQRLRAERARHERWIAELRAGRNPFTAQELEALLDLDFSEF